MLGVDTVRVFAATAPFAALPLALAAAVITRRPAAVPAVAAKPEPEPAGWMERPSRQFAAPLVVGAALLALLFVGPPVAMAAVGRPSAPARLCPDGRPAEPLIGGVAVRVVPDGTRRAVDDVGAAAFAAQVPYFLPVPGKHFTGNPPWTLVDGLTLTGTDRFAVVDRAVVAPRTSALYLCGDVAHDPDTDASFAIYPDPVDVFRGHPLP
jgi:hypothetical protein